MEERFPKGVIFIVSNEFLGYVARRRGDPFNSNLSRILVADISDCICVGVDLHENGVKKGDMVDVVFDNLGHVAEVWSGTRQII